MFAKLKSAAFGSSTRRIFGQKSRQSMMLRHAIQSSLDPGLIPNASDSTELRLLRLCSDTGFWSSNSFLMSGFSPL